MNDQRTETALRQTTRLLETILDSTHAMVACMDADFNFIMVNPAYAKADDRVPSFFPGKNHFDLYPGEAKILFQQVLDTGQPVFLNARPFVYEKNPERGTTYWDWSLVPIKDDNQNVTGLVMTLLDVTARIKTEQKLHESTERLRAVIDNTTAFIYVKDRAGRFMLANRRLCELTRLTEEAMTGKTENDLFTPKHAEEHAIHDREVLIGARAMEFEENYTALDGTLGTVLSVKVPLFDSDGKVYGLCGISTDITAKKRAEHLLSNYAESIAEIAPVMVATINPKLEMTRVNSYTSHLLGYEETQLLGHGWMNLMPQETLAYVLQYVNESFNNNILTQGLEVELPCKDGRNIITRWYSSMQRDDGGEAVGLITIGVDITDMRNAEEQLRQAAKLEAIGRLAGGVAHDFNNYLTAIKGYASLLAAEASPDTQTATDLAEIVNAADAAAELTRQLLTVGRRAEIHPSVRNLNHIISAMERTLRQMLREDIELSFDLDPELHNIKIDAGQMQQVLLNLAINARDAMPKGGTLRISTRNLNISAEQPLQACAPGDYVEMTFTDTGIGMSAETLQHIFEPFYTTKDGTGGTGLGLATIHGIVKQAGGYIFVDSTQEEGTRFRLSFPQVQAEEDAEKPSQEKEPDLQGNETILVVEDEPALRRYITRVLSESGYNILETGTPGEALSLLHKCNVKVDLLLSDVVLPQMNGIKLAEKVHEILLDMPTLFISGYTRDAIPNHDIALADIELINKPFLSDELCQRIRQKLDAHKQKKHESAHRKKPKTQ